VSAIKNGYDGVEENKWTFAGAFLYSLTVITTIGESRFYIYYYIYYYILSIYFQFTCTILFALIFQFILMFLFLSIKEKLNV